MRPFLLSLVFSASISIALSDSNVEKALRDQVQQLSADNIRLRKSLASKDSSITKQLNQAANATAAQLRTHAEEKGAVIQAQVESTRIVEKAEDISLHQIEFEKQLIALQQDLAQVVSTQLAAHESQVRGRQLGVSLFLAMLAFTGSNIYAVRRINLAVKVLYTPKDPKDLKDPKEPDNTNGRQSTELEG